MTRLIPLAYFSYFVKQTTNFYIHINEVILIYNTNNLTHWNYKMHIGESWRPV